MQLVLYTFCDYQTTPAFDRLPRSASPLSHAPASDIVGVDSCGQSRSDPLGEDIHDYDTDIVQRSDERRESRLFIRCQVYGDESLVSELSYPSSRRVLRRLRFSDTNKKYNNEYGIDPSKKEGRRDRRNFPPVVRFDGTACVRNVSDDNKDLPCTTRAVNRPPRWVYRIRQSLHCEAWSWNRDADERINRSKSRPWRPQKVMTT